MPGGGLNGCFVEAGRDLHREIGKKFASCTSLALPITHLIRKSAAFLDIGTIKNKGKFHFHNPAQEFPPQIPELVIEMMVICFHFRLSSLSGESSTHSWVYRPTEYAFLSLAHSTFRDTLPCTRHSARPGEQEIVKNKTLPCWILWCV